MIRFPARVWRMTLAGRDALAPAGWPEGRFHHSGQTAVYTSLTPEGTVVASRLYMSPGDPPRLIHPLLIAPARVADLRGRPEASVVWQDLRATGAPSPTWALSDAARNDGAQAMLYSSRSRPDLSHLVVFDLSVLSHDPGTAAIAWHDTPTDLPA